MATIWAARRSGSRGFQQIVAVKVLSDMLREDPDGRAMFLDEARTAARIIHPNVGQVIDYGEDEGRPYLTMEWIDGESLARLAAAKRAQGGRMPLRWVLRVAADACAGLHAAHEARDDDGEPMGLVHRDISPQNVMVTWGGVAKVVDFGVAKSRRRAQVTRVGVIKGKTGYFSPEQIGGREIDRRSDIFSFGILLYVLVTDHHPFRGRSAIETVQNIANREPFSPRELVPDLPPALDALIMRALAKDPAERFATAAELGRALELCAVTLAPGTFMDSIDAEPVSSRGPLSNRAVGAVMRSLLPEAEATRRTRLARSAALLDEVRARAAQAQEEQGPTEITLLIGPGGRRGPDEVTRAEGLVGEETGIDVTFDDDDDDIDVDVDVDDDDDDESSASYGRSAGTPRREGPASRTPQGTSLASLSQQLPVPVRRKRATSALLPALLTVGAILIATRAGERFGLAPAEVTLAARAGVALAASDAAAQAQADAEMAADAEAGTDADTETDTETDANMEMDADTEAGAEADAEAPAAEPPPAAIPAPAVKPVSDARRARPQRGAPTTRATPRGGSGRSAIYEPRGL